MILFYSTVSNMNKWNLDTPRQAEEALYYFFSLPDNEIHSDEEGDKGAENEFQELENTEILNTRSLSTRSCSPSHNLLDSTIAIQTSTQQSCDVEEEFHTDVPEIVEDLEVPEEDDNSSSDTDSEEEWNDNTEYFDLLKTDFDQYNPSSTHNFCIRNKEIDYFLKNFTPEMIQAIVDQTNLYASQNLQRRSNKKYGPGPSKF